MADSTRYRSFDEIDKRLKILRLQREIDRENLKLHLAKAKARLLPLQVFVQTTGVLKNFMIALAAKKITHLFRKRRSAEALEE
ncbi:DUF6327 family protein [Flagellimonas lutaonensis]|uniref:Glutaminyl-tRNA synthetase n=1 Tax=Flagellimonas lutaonensis TaxID=516051 RepID=A0A0D5YQQ4_9FLAO|nr:DUF6327 family protein [Allomuricauda lutaonensis]AKA34223.1 hypothetical protein VC82_549 [Allomuricauda lutaonensis]